MEEKEASKPIKTPIDEAFQQWALLYLIKKVLCGDFFFFLYELIGDSIKSLVK